MNFILFPQLIVPLSTLNNYACLLPPLVNVNCFSRVLDHIIYKFTTGKMVPVEGSESAVLT